ncbi:MAG: TnpV protein [Solirubrobacteraceae bacterium]|jgi:hypothetical protein
MNKYGRLAMSHWQKTDPDRYAQIPDPEAFFGELGERAEVEIQQLQDAIAGSDRPGEGYLEKVGRLNMARLSAEEQVLAESILIPGPASSEEEEEGPEGTLEYLRDLGRARREIEHDEP